MAVHPPPTQKKNIVYFSLENFLIITILIQNNTKNLDINYIIFPNLTLDLLLPQPSEAEQVPLKISTFLGRIKSPSFIRFVRPSIHICIMNYPKKTGFNLYQSRHCTYITYSVKTWFLKIFSVGAYILSETEFNNVKFEYETHVNYLF